MDLADVPRHRPLAFDKMESLIKEMQEAETGVPVRSQKLFLTFIPSAFMGYDLIEWLMDRFNMEDNVEAINLANQLCQYGYFFPVNDSKNLTLKDDSSLYRFQSPYYWPWSAPRAVCAGAAASPSPGSTDNLEYAIYLVKRTLRNKQRHGLEEYELEALSNLRKNLAAKWDFITMQAEEQVRLAKDRKKGDKIVSDSQERAYWRVARPPPGLTSALDSCPVPARSRQPRHRRRTLHQLNKEVELLKASLDRTRVKVSIALEALLAYSETYAPWDPWLTPPQPSNPWCTDDTFFWQINSDIVETPTEKRLQRWALSMEELVSDPTGLQEFTSFLRKEYSHENIRFWLAVKDLRRSSQRHVQRKLTDIYDEFLKPGAPCEINIDGATKERVAEALKSGSRFALDHAADHVYSLLLKKDCYPRFVRSEHFRILTTASKNVQHKKRFFGFGGQVKKKSAGSSTEARAGGAGLGRRRGSDRSLSGSAHELAVCGTQPTQPYVPHAHPPPPHSHSQSDLSDVPYSRETDDESAEALPWESTGPPRRRKDSVADSGSSSSDVSGIAGASGHERLRRLPQQSTLDGGLRGAPPPLRRLSAVEPRHLAPLCSPPQTPRISRASTNNPPNYSALERPMPPQPTPTISVSSAPDEESTEATTPEEPASLSKECVADDPPSVFSSSSREHSPPKLNDSATKLDSTATTEPLERPTDKTCEKPSPNDNQKEISSKEQECIKADQTAGSSITENVTKQSIVKEPKDPRNTPAIIVASEDKTDSKETHSQTTKLTPSIEIQSKNIPNTSPETAKAADTPSVHLKEHKQDPLPSTSSSPESTRGEPAIAIRHSTESVPTASHSKTVAPLAESEDVGTDDDNLDKVPSVRRGDAGPTRAPLDIVKDKDNKCDAGASGDPLQRNDVCPWEDENSCQTDAPFVKTYATLGYL